MKFRFFFVLALALLAFGSLNADTVVQEIVARVNSSIITRSDLAREKEQIDNEQKQQNLPADDARAKQAQKDILRGLIDQQLLIAKAKDLGITGDTELVKRLDEMRKSMHLESMEDLEKEAQKQGVSFEDFKQNMRNQILTSEVIQREVAPKIQITPDEVKKYYEQHKQEFDQPEYVDLSEILVSTGSPDVKVDPNAPAAPDDPAKIAAAEKKAKDLLAQIKAGAKFADVAKKSSDGPTADQGGELGQFKRGTLAKELEDLTFKMKPGEVSDAVRTKQGFVLLKVNEHTQAGVAPLPQVERRIQEAIYYDKLQPTLRTYLTKLREDAYIDIKAGYVDTGASPNQTSSGFCKRHACACGGGPPAARGLRNA
jgi:peptidyl-prolyl cis-trans isomerase SurA